MKVAKEYQVAGIAMALGLILVASGISRENQNNLTIEEGVYAAEAILKGQGRPGEVSAVKGTAVRPGEAQLIGDQDLSSELPADTVFSIAKDIIFPAHKDYASFEGPWFDQGELQVQPRCWLYSRTAPDYARVLRAGEQYPIKMGCTHIDRSSERHGGTKDTVSSTFLFQADALSRMSCSLNVWRKISDGIQHEGFREVPYGELKALLKDYITIIPKPPVPLAESHQTSAAPSPKEVCNEIPKWWDDSVRTVWGRKVLDSLPPFGTPTQPPARPEPESETKPQVPGSPGGRTHRSSVQDAACRNVFVVNSDEESARLCGQFNFCRWEPGRCVGGIGCLGATTGDVCRQYAAIGCRWDPGLCIAR